MSIPEAAIEAAAEAFRDHFNVQFYDDTRFVPCTWAALAEVSKQKWRDHARIAIEAAMPAIREAIAQELDEAWLDSKIYSGLDAARIVRGGAA